MSMKSQVALSRHLGGLGGHEPGPRWLWPEGVWLRRSDLDWRGLCLTDGLKRLLRNRFSLFLSVWNKLRRSLETNGEWCGPLCPL